MISRFATAVIFGVVAQAAVLVAFAGDVVAPTSVAGSKGIAVATAVTATEPIRIPAARSTEPIDAPARSTTVSPSEATAVPALTHPFAAPQAVAAPTAPNAGGVAQVTFALLLVLVAIFAFAWIARRMRGFNNRVGDAVDILADVPLGQKERAVLLKVGQKQILVGVAPGRVNTLHVLEEPLDLKTKPAAGADDSRPNFKQLMLRSLGK